MKAAILHRLRAPLVVDNLQLPDKLDFGQVLVEVHASGVCGAQLREIDGARGEDPFLPHLLGHEGGGIVAKTGPGVTCVEKGDHVVMHWRTGNGIDAPFPKYRWGSRKGKWVGGGKVTTFNEYAVVSENRVTAIKKDVPFEIAALMGCSTTTAMGLINNEAVLKIGQSIAIAGCGGVGLSVIQAAQMVSAYPIIAIDITPEKLDMARDFGATHCLGLMDLKERIYHIVGSRGVDVFVECVGSVDLIEKGYSVTAPGGKTILVGQPHHRENLIIKAVDSLYQGKTLIDSQGGRTNPTEDIPRYVNLFRHGHLKLEHLLTHSFPLDEVNEAVRIAREGKAGRCMLLMN